MFVGRRFDSPFCSHVTMLLLISGTLTYRSHTAERLSLLLHLDFFLSRDCLQSAELVLANQLTVASYMLRSSFCLLGFPFSEYCLHACTFGQDGITHQSHPPDPGIFQHPTEMKHRYLSMAACLGWA